MESLSLHRTRWVFGILDILLLPVSVIGWGPSLVARSECRYGAHHSFTGFQFSQAVQRRMQIAPGVAIANGCTTVVPVID